MHSSSQKEANYNKIYQEYDQKCKKILKMQYIRFAAMIDESGMIVAGGFIENQETIIQTPNQAYLYDILKEISARVSKRKKHDKELGLVKYSASRRENVVIMSFPVYKNAIAIIAEPNINIDRIAWKIIEILGEQWSEFVGK